MRLGPWVVYTIGGERVSGWASDGLVWVFVWVYRDGK